MIISNIRPVKSIINVSALWKKLSIVVVPVHSCDGIVEYVYITVLMGSVEKWKTL